MLHAEFEEWISPLTRLVEQAGKSILDIRGGEISVDAKADQSPVTQADRLSQEIILTGLNQISPQLPVISEENTAPPWQERRYWTTLWLVDPLDGTREFIEGRDEFTINVALISSGLPVLGMIYQPVTGRLLISYQKSSEGSNWTVLSRDSQGRISNQPFQADSRVSDRSLKVVVSRRYGDTDVASLPKKLTNTYPKIEKIKMGSALKFCLLTQGAADFYVRRAPTCAWDTAAGQALLTAVGGGLCDFDGNTLTYNRSESLVNPPFYAFGPSLASRDWL